MTRSTHAAFWLALALVLFASLSAAAKKTTPAEPLDLNAASAEQLTRLPGIGPRRAADIVAQRETRRFERVSDLLRVRGIGRRTYIKLKPYLTVRPKGGAPAS
jgi:competence protein ComEA